MPPAPSAVVLSDTSSRKSVNPFELLTSIVDKTAKSTAELHRPLVESIMSTEESEVVLAPHQLHLLQDDTLAVAVVEDVMLESELLQEQVDDALAYLLESNEM
eukprot:gene36000-44400_t